MTSRRSRLKAVTNLPVRRKAPPSQGSTEDAVSVDNLTPVKTLTGSQKSEVITLFTSAKTDDIPNKETSESEHAVIVNCVENINNSAEYINEVVVNETESEVVGTSESVTELTDNVPTLIRDSNSNSLRGAKSYKPNLISAGSENPESQAGGKKETVQTSDKQNCAIINNNNTSTNKNNNISNNNNILEEGTKCYTVLTTQTVTIPPLSEFTLTPLTPCDNSYINSNVSDGYSTQQYEEVHIYTDIDSNEIYVQEESVVETKPSDSIIIKISNGVPESDINNLHINFRNLDSNSLESNSNSVSMKADIENKNLNFKNNFCGNFEYYKSTNLQLSSDTQSLENSVSSNVSVDAYPSRKSITTVRRKRSKCNDFTKKLADAKREFLKKYENMKPDRSNLKMIDLIFYNPATNPMESKIKFEKKDAPESPSNLINNLLAEEKVDEPDALDCNIKSQMSDNEETENMNKMPVPQVKIGLDGEIILDEKSVVIETTDAKRGREELQNSVPVFEERGCNVSYYRGKSRKSRDWTDFETKRFYKALNTIGPDFSLMQKYFPKRSRLELKNKFKREEKLNRNLIDKALNNPSEFDMTELEKDLAIEKEAEEEEIGLRLSKMLKRKKKKYRVKSSMLSREMIDSEDDSDCSQPEVLEINPRQMSENEKNKKKLEFDFVLEKLLMKK